ncbi:MAG TPA: sugar phosphate nucleotidyltransferase, partial [Paludibacteraceae bacterium]|nr:sugar phosphate nucleotidyltransferase [Paludibacteraceae bacterium]
MDAIVLAGGLGTRLRSVVSEVPKCMAPVCGKPFLYYLLSYLNKYKEINKVILSVGFLREHIFNWIDENRSQFNFEIDYAIEENPLGTGGGIKLALSKTQAENVLILNGDTFF